MEDVSQLWNLMFWPCAACILLPWLLVYLGLHVVQRGIIFIDIAMAQMASLGICLGVLLNYEPESVMSYALGLGVTLLGAAIFSMSAKRASQVPQEAIIGITYVVAAAAAVLLLNRSAHGNEEIRNMLVGDITFVSAAEVWNASAFSSRSGSSISSSGKTSCSFPFNARKPTASGGGCAGGIFSSTPPSALS